MNEPHSKWKCKGCDRTYESPIVGTESVGHTCNAGDRIVWRNWSRVWRSKYDKMKG